MLNAAAGGAAIGGTLGVGAGAFWAQREAGYPEPPLGKKASFLGSVGVELSVLLTAGPLARGSGSQRVLASGSSLAPRAGAEQEAGEGAAADSVARQRASLATWRIGQVKKCVTLFGVAAVPVQTSIK